MAADAQAPYVVRLCREAGYCNIIEGDDKLVEADTCNGRVIILSVICLFLTVH